MIRLNDDPKLQAILESAWAAFSAYGFRKTSMDDIARGAGMSRPALYLHFRNKEAIFTALVEAHYSHAQAGVAAALAGGGSLAARLAAGFAAHGGQAMEAAMTSPHGMEAFEAGMSVAPAAVETGELALRTVYADWLHREAAAGRVQLTGPAEDTARLFCAALKGIKYTAAGFADYSAAVARLARLMARAVEPR